MSVEELIDQAVGHHDAGRRQEAEVLYHQVLRAAPDHPDALYFLGVLAGERGEHTEAMRLMGRAVAVDPNSPDFRLGYARLLASSGQLDRATEEYLAAVDRAEGDLDLLLEAALGLTPIAPARAIPLLGDLAAIQSRDPRVISSLAYALGATGQWRGAIERYTQAIALQPNDMELRHALAKCQWQGEQQELAIKTLRDLLTRDPAHAMARNHLVYFSAAEMDIAERLSEWQKAFEAQPDCWAAYDNYLYSLFYSPAHDGTSITAEYRRWGRRFLAGIEPLPPALAPTASIADRTLKIGYVSADFRRHVAGPWLETILRHHDRRMFKIVCYVNHASEDDVTLRCRSLADGWRAIHPLTDAQAAELVRADSIDVLVDCNAHTAGNRLGLFARRPALTQITGIGFPATTGLLQMGYRLSDDIMDPPELAAACNTERIVPLPGGFYCYVAPDPLPPLAPLPALSNGYIRLGCLNNAAKVSPESIAIFASVMQRLPGSRILLVREAWGEGRQKCREAFAMHGVTPDRIDFIARGSTEAYLLAHQQTDIALDSVPCGGGITTCDALLMGVPVVTLAGSTSPSRAGASLLSRVGLNHLIAHSTDDYIQIVVRLASDLPALASLRAELPERLRTSSVMDVPAHVRSLEEIYRRIHAQSMQLELLRGPAMELCHQAVASLQEGDGTKVDTKVSEALGLVAAYPELSAHIAQLVASFAAERAAVALRAALPYLSGGDAYNSLGLALVHANRLDESIAAFGEGAKRDPLHAELLGNFAATLQTAGRFAEAQEVARKAVEAEPLDATARVRYANVFRGLGRIEPALEQLQRAIELAPLNIEIAGDYLYTLLFSTRHDGLAIYEKHRQWGDRLIASLPTPRLHAIDHTPGRRLRIGYLSPDFCDHVVGLWLERMLAAHDRSRFDLILYSAMQRESPRTAQFKRVASQWRVIFSQSDEQAAETIRQDRVDILIDLASHSGGSRLGIFARKPAPVQITHVAYPGTTGLSRIDYRITDALLDPPGSAEECSAEKLLRLPGGFYYYADYPGSPAVTPLPAITNGYVTFGCLNSPYKITTATMELLAQVLLRVSRSRLLLVANSAELHDIRCQFFGERGVDPGRVDYIQPGTVLSYLQAHQRTDIALDPIPVCGGITTCDALYMGIPLVTLTGDRSFSRAGVSILHRVGLDHLVASAPDRYIEIAASLAADLPTLAQVRGSLRDRMRVSSLMDIHRHTREVEAALEEAWRRQASG